MDSTTMTFEEFVAARSGALQHTAWLLTGDEQLAQDLVQTALLKVWPHWSRIVRRGHPDPYVRRVMVTTYSSWWRRKWRGEVSTDAVPDQASADADMDAADIRESVRRALGVLPRGQRAVIVLRHFDDLTEAQTAAALGVSIGTVKSQHARAIAALRGSPHLAGVRVDELAGGAQ